MKLLLSLSAAALCLASIAASADTPGITFTGTTPSNTFNNGNGYGLGYDFSVNSNLYVTSLGYFYNSTYTTDHAVGLFDSNGNLLASAIINNGSTTSDSFKWTSITPVELLAGETYQVVGISGVTDPYTFDPDGFAVDPSINYLNDVYVGGSSLQFAPSSDANTGYFGANFEEVPSIAQTPEPGSFILLGTGVLGAVGLLRRRFLAA